jgi:transposase-like protein
MKPNCPNFSCEFHQRRDHIIKNGSYFRKDDSRKVLRFKCKSCGKRFSAGTTSLEWRQKKRRVNHELFSLLASGVSMRRAAILLKIHRVTVHRKLIYLAKKARLEHQNFLKSLREIPVSHLQFDDVITTEHTKLKPLSISVAVDAKRRIILGVEVSSIGAFGHLAKISRAKYGKRKNNHPEKLRELFATISHAIDPHVKIDSDEHYRYSDIVKEYFPMANYRQYKGSKACVVGQGELKRLHRDPLFKINHTCAMLRANINRLFRRTWCTTKRPDMLKNHLDIYLHFHNNYLLKN